MTRELVAMQSPDQPLKKDNPILLPGLQFINGLPEITKPHMLPAPGGFAPMIPNPPYIITPNPMLTTRPMLPPGMPFPQTLSIHPQMVPVTKMEGAMPLQIKSMPQYPVAQVQAQANNVQNKKPIQQNDIFPKKKTLSKNNNTLPINNNPTASNPINIISQVSPPSMYRTPTHVNAPLSPFGNIARANAVDSNFDRLKGVTKKTVTAPSSPPVKLKGTRVRKQRAKDDPNSTLNYCRSCGQTKTSEWRRGPDGYKSLCNACGIHYAKVVKKEEEDLHSYKPKSLSLNMLLS